MPERNIPALGLALALGFIEGMVAATEQLTGGPAWILGIVGVTAVFIASGLGMIGVEAERNDLILTGLLRAAVASGVFLCLYTGLLQLGSSGKVGAFLILFFLSIGLAVVSTRIRTRALVPEEATTDEEAEEAEAREEERESEESDEDTDEEPREEVRERELSSERDGAQDSSSDRERESAPS
jgi:hypothetical protein